jgi:hypothetical protein
MKKVFDMEDLFDAYEEDGDLIDRFGKHAEFQGRFHVYTLFGWVVCRDYRLARRLIQDIDVNAWCCKTFDGDQNTPIEMVVLSNTPSVNERMNILRLLMIHGADPGNVDLVTLETNRFLHGIHGIDLLGDAQAYAKEFRAKLCAIFWVTQNIPVWRDMGEPLVERVFMSTLQIDHPEWRFG